MKKLSIIVITFLISLGSFAQDTSIRNYSNAPRKFKKGVDKMLIEYLKMKNAFVKDDTTSIKHVFALSLENATSSVNTDKVNAEQKNYFEKHAQSISKLCEKLSTQESTMLQKREYFKQITYNLYVLLKSFKANRVVVYKQYCPMAFNNTGAYWLSDKKQIINPYFGAKMLHCGDVIEVLD